MLIIKDNFFKDPYEVRRIALQGNYAPGPRYTYPGYRSFTLPQNVINHLTSEVRYFTKNPSLTMGGGAFQYITQDFISGIYHFDDEYTYTSVTFLSLDPPDNSGTEVSSVGRGDRGAPPMPDEGEGWDKSIEVRKDFHRDPSNFINAYKYRRTMKKINSKSKQVTQIPNKYNRFVVFDSPMFHRAQDFFGTSIEDSRLTIISFFI